MDRSILAIQNCIFCNDGKLALNKNEQVNNTILLYLSCFNCDRFYVVGIDVTIKVKKELKN